MHEYHNLNCTNQSIHQEPMPPLPPTSLLQVSECSYAKIRGFLGSLPALFMAGGILLSYIMGAWLPWNQLAWASAVFPALLLFIMIPLPESPVWLLSKGRTSDAQKALKWLHHQRPTPNDSIPVELQQVSVYAITSETTQATDSSNNKSGSGFSRKDLFVELFLYHLCLPSCYKYFSSSVGYKLSYFTQYLSFTQLEVN
jgi:MFS family permease